MKKPIIFVGIDAQVDFITGTLANEKAQENVKLLSASAEQVRNRNGIIYWTQDTHESEEEYMNTLEGKLLPIHHCQYGTEGWKLHPDIKTDRTDRFIIKPTFGSFDLPHEIMQVLVERNGVECIIMGGYDTEICGASNALILRAHFPNVPIYWLAYACAGVTPESNAAGLTVMQSCQVNIIYEYETFLELLEKGAEL